MVAKRCSISQPAARTERRSGSATTGGVRGGRGGGVSIQYGGEGRGVYVQYGGEGRDVSVQYGGGAGRNSR